MAATGAALAQQRGETDITEHEWRNDVRARALARRPHEPERPRRIGRFAWLIALAFHLAVVVALRIALRPPDVRPSADTNLRVELIEPPVAEPAPLSPPPPIAQAPAPTSSLRRTVPPPLEAPPRPEATRSPGPLPRLFDDAGAAALPRDIAAQLDSMRPRPDFVPRRFDPSPLLLARRPLKVRPNHFAAVWAGSDGKPLSETIWEPVTFVTEFRAPWGGRYACGLILVLFACADVPDKPWIAPQTWTPASVLDEE